MSVKDPALALKSENLEVSDLHDVLCASMSRSTLFWCIGRQRQDSSDELLGLAQIDGSKSCGTPSFIPYCHGGHDVQCITGRL